MEQSVRTHRRSKLTYEALIREHRSELTDDEMAVLLALYENKTIELAAADLAISVEEIDTVLKKFFPPPRERRTKSGELYKKRLSRATLRLLLENVDDFSEHERGIITALADAPNQTVAALSINMTYKEFMKEYMAIRRRHDI